MARISNLAFLVSATAFAVTLSGCAYGPPPDLRTGAGTGGAGVRSDATSADRRVPPVAERDRVLFDYRSAASALRAGDYDEAKAKLDDAIARIGGIITNDADAARARVVCR
jgi:hypothetical protein